MSRPDRDQDWNPRMAALSQSQLRKRKSELRIIERAALSADYTTGDRHWDELLSIVNAKIIGLQGQLDDAVEAIKNSDDFTTEPLINQKLAVRLLGREIEALEWVIKLPQELMEQGAKARELLGTIDESSD